MVLQHNLDERFAEEPTSSDAEWEAKWHMWQAEEKRKKNPVSDTQSQVHDQVTGITEGGKQ